MQNGKSFMKKTNKNKFKFENTLYVPKTRYFKIVRTGNIYEYKDLIDAIGLGLFQTNFDMTEDEWLQYHINKNDIIEVDKEGNKI